MSEKFIRNFLRGIGLTNRESDVYVFLAKSGTQKGGNVAKNMKMHKAQVYRILHSLESRDMVKTSLESPTRFAAVSFKEVLNLHIREKQEETILLKNMKNDLLNHWKSISGIERVDLALEKFAVIQGLNKIYSRIFQMIKEAEKEILVVISGVTLIHTVQMGVPNAIFEKVKKSDVKLRLLTQISEENLEILRQNIRKFNEMKLDNKIIGRFIKTDSQLHTRFFIKDGVEAVFFLTIHEDYKAKAEDVSLWTNSKAVVHTLESFFEELWNNALPIPTIDS